MQVDEEDGHPVPATSFFGYRCSVGSAHAYARQGVYALTVHASQPRDGGTVRVRIRGGLLGHWADWTKRGV